MKFRWDATNEADNSDVNFSITLFSDGRVRYDYGSGNAGLTPTVGVSSGNGRAIELVLATTTRRSLTNANSVEFNLAAGIRDIGAYEFLGDSGDQLSPTILSIVPNAIYAEGSTAESIQQLQLLFSEPVNAIDAGAPIYELRSDGGDNAFDNAGDVVYNVTALYVPSSNNVVLSLQNGGAPLPAGRYRLKVTSNVNTSIHDLSGNSLDGDNNGSAGGDFVRVFRVIANNAPGWNGSFDFPNINEDISSALNVGTLVSTISQGRFSDLDGPGSGLAVSSVDDANGVWEYTVNGTTFAAIAPELTGGRVLLLAAEPTVRVRFQPLANFFGPAGAIRYRAWDRADENPSGASVVASLLNTNSLSLDEFTSTISVNPINDAPSSILLSNNTIAEKMAIGSLVGELSAVDVDSSSPYSFSLVEGPGSNDNFRFVVVGNELRINEVLDFEAQSTHSIRLRATDDAGGSLETVFAIGVDNTPIRVTGVYVRGSGWNSNYLAMLAANNLGSTIGGFRLVDGVNQLANSSLITWQTINQISVTFDESAIIDPNALRILNGTNQDLALSATGYTYDAATKTARWTLNTALVAGRFLVSLESAMIADGGSAMLDGEWATSVDTYATSGDGLAGGDLNFRFSYLPGDVSRNGQTNPGDVNLLRSLGTIIPDATNYWRDVTGNNQINPGDVNFVRSLGTVVLPAATPTTPPPPRGGAPLISAAGFASPSENSGVQKLSDSELKLVSSQAIDIWAAVLHEFGHLLGLEDLHDTSEENELMYERLSLDISRHPNQEKSKVVGENRDRVLAAEHYRTEDNLLDLDWVGLTQERHKRMFRK